MYVYKIYTHIGNHVARGSLSDTVLTKILTVGSRVFALGWLIPGMNCTKNQERFLHIVAQETINFCYFGILKSNAHPDFEGDIWLKKVHIIFA